MASPYSAAPVACMYTDYKPVLHWILLSQSYKRAKHPTTSGRPVSPFPKSVRKSSLLECCSWSRLFNLHQRFFILWTRCHQYRQLYCVCNILLENDNSWTCFFPNPTFCSLYPPVCCVLGQCDPTGTDTSWFWSSHTQLPSWHSYLSYSGVFIWDAPIILTFDSFDVKTIMVSHVWNYGLLKKNHGWTTSLPGYCVRT